MINLVDCPPELARLRLQALYRRDRRGRLVSVNEWNGGAAPRFHLMRTAKKASGNIVLIWPTISLNVSKSCTRKNPSVGDKPHGRASIANILNY
jgi:hypothetical protein